MLSQTPGDVMPDESARLIEHHPPGSRNLVKKGPIDQGVQIEARGPLPESENDDLAQAPGRSSTSRMTASLSWTMGRETDCDSIR